MSSSHSPDTLSKIVALNNVILCNEPWAGTLNLLDAIIALADWHSSDEVWYLHPFRLTEVLGHNVASHAEPYEHNLSVRISVRQVVEHFVQIICATCQNKFCLYIFRPTKYNWECLISTDSFVTFSYLVLTSHETSRVLCFPKLFTLLPLGYVRDWWYTYTTLCYYYNKNTQDTN